MKEWIDVPAVRRTIMRAFKDFLMTYVDEHGTSVYGQRIKALGEGQSLFTFANRMSWTGLDALFVSLCSQL